MTEIFNGPYIVDSDKDSTGSEWHERFFANDVPRGYVKIVENRDSIGSRLGQTALFRCPCPYAEVMNLPINDYPTKNAKWSFSESLEGLMTLSPSIQNHALNAPSGKHICCNSHFFISNGMVEWC